MPYPLIFAEAKRLSMISSVLCRTGKGVCFFIFLILRQTTTMARHWSQTAFLA